MMTAEDRDRFVSSEKLEEIRQAFEAFYKWSSERDDVVPFMMCIPCRDKGLRGHMLKDDDGLHWTCTDCGDQRPTPKQIIADCRATLAANPPPQFPYATRKDT